MLLVPFRRLTVRSELSESDTADALRELFQQAPINRAISHHGLLFSRWDGTIMRNVVHLRVPPRAWRQIPYLPIGYGGVASVGNGASVSVVFRPELAELSLLAILLLIAVALEGLSWFVLLVLGVYHLVGCLVGFGPAVNDISAALEAALRTRHPEPSELRGAAEHGDEADER